MDQLVHFNRAKAELAKATKIDEVKEIRDKAEALRVYARQAGESLEMQNQCAEIKLRAERRGGEILKEQEKHEGGRPTKNQSHDATSLEPPKLSDLGISKSQSSRWQAIAGLPEEDFERHIAETKDKERELTTVGILKLAQKLKIKERNRGTPRGLDECSGDTLVEYGRVGAGNWKCKLSWFGPNCVHVECVDPEYDKLKAGAAPLNLHSPIGQAISSIESARKKIERVHKKFGHAVYDAYELSWNEGVKHVFPELMTAYKELEKIVSKVEMARGFVPTTHNRGQGDT